MENGLERARLSSLTHKESYKTVAFWKRTKQEIELLCTELPFPLLLVIIIGLFFNAFYSTWFVYVTHSSVWLIPEGIFSFNNFLIVLNIKLLKNKIIKLKQYRNVWSKSSQSPSTPSIPLFKVPCYYQFGLYPFRHIKIH